MSTLAVVRIRGGIGVSQQIKDTLSFLHLDRKNYCAVMNNDASFIGMIARVKDFVTWGDVTDDTLKSLEKRKLKHKKENQKITVYALQPPKKGYGKKGVKVPYTKGGALGNRQKDINDLLVRMA